MLPAPAEAVKSTRDVATAKNFMNHYRSDKK